MFSLMKLLVFSWRSSWVCRYSLFSWWKKGTRVAGSTKGRLGLALRGSCYFLRAALLLVSSIIMVEPVGSLSMLAVNSFISNYP